LDARQSYQQVLDLLAKLALLQLKPISKVSRKVRGTICMFVAYSVQHVNDLYRMMNLDTNSIIQSQDIICLNEAIMIRFKRWFRKRKRIIQKSNDSQAKLISLKDHNELKKKNVYRPKRLLKSSFNPEASSMLQNIEQGSEILLEQANVTF
jgi:hypothetical protein